MKTFRILPLVTAAILVATTVAFAQAPQGPGSGVNTALTKLFGNHTSFSGKAEVQMSGGATGDMTMTMDMAMLEGKVRSDIDMGTMKSAQLPPDAVQAMKQMGMDRMASIVTPQENTMCLIYPGLKSYAEMALPRDEAAAMKETYNVEKTEVGKETVAGRATVKHKVTITDSKGKKQEALMWTAPDLKDFPVKIEMTEQGSTIAITYKDVKLAKPDAALFLPPKEFTKHANVQALMQAAMMKMIGGAQK